MKRKNSVFQDFEEMGCCNLVLWDFIMAALMAGKVVYSWLHLHIGIGIVAGIIGGAAAVILMGREKTAKACRIVCCVCWGFMAWEALGVFFGWGKTVKVNPLWPWVVRLAVFAVAMAMHFPPVRKGRQASDPMRNVGGAAAQNPQAREMDDGSQERAGLQKRCDALRHTYDAGVQQWNAVIGWARQQVREGKGGSQFAGLVQEKEAIWQEGMVRMASYLGMMAQKKPVEELRAIMEKAEALQRQLEQAMRILSSQSQRVQQTEGSRQSQAQQPPGRSGQAAGEDWFAGCDTRESLQKRYKKLMKTYHPDNVGGDETMAMKISAAYEERIKDFT